MKCRIFSIGIALSVLVGSVVQATEVGRITTFDKKYWKMFVSGQSGKREAARAGILEEGDEIQTIASQHIAFLLDDGTAVSLGPSTRVKIANWTKRDSNNRLVRKLELVSGMLMMRVSKVYSEDEPFVVESSHGAIGVRGTEFVLESGAGGRLEHARALSAEERHARASEIEVHTLEGEVYFAKNASGLREADQRVIVPAGQTSLVRSGMSRPQPPHEYDVSRFRGYISRALPAKAKVFVYRKSTNDARAAMAVNATGGGKESISPARPDFARVERGALDRQVEGQRVDKLAAKADARVRREVVAQKKESEESNRKIAAEAPPTVRFSRDENQPQEIVRVRNNDRAPKGRVVSATASDMAGRGAHENMRYMNLPKASQRPDAAAQTLRAAGMSPRPQPGGPPPGGEGRPRDGMQRAGTPGTR